VSVTFTDADGAVTALDRLARLEDNWDGHGAVGISEAVIIRTRRLLSAFALARFPTPALVPTTCGGIQLEWHAGGLDVEIDLDPKTDDLIADVSCTGG